MRLIICMCLLMFLVSGCLGGSQGPVSILKFDVSQFEKQADQKVELGEQSVAVSLNLYDLPQVIQFNIPASQQGELVGIRLLEDQLLNIDRHLLFNREYGIDEQGVLKVQVKAPFIYLLNGQVRYRLELLYFDRDRHAVIRDVKYISLNWQPMEKNTEVPMSFSYVNPLDGLEREILSQEAKKAKVERFSLHYAQKVRDIID